MIGYIVLSWESATLIGAFMLFIAGLHGLISWRMVSDKNRDMVFLRKERDRYKTMADEAIAELEQKINVNLGESGMRRMTVLDAVCPEHNSPPSAAQIETAENATLRARLVACQLVLHGQQFTLSRCGQGDSESALG